MLKGDLAVDMDFAHINVLYVPKGCIHISFKFCHLKIGYYYEPTILRYY